MNRIKLLTPLLLAKGAGYIRAEEGDTVALSDLPSGLADTLVNKGLAVALQDEPAKAKSNQGAAKAKAKVGAKAPAKAKAKPQKKAKG